MKVRDIMTTHIVEVQQTDTCQRAAELMRDHHVGCLLVVSSEGQIEGVVTDRDLVVNGVALGRDPMTEQVGQCMTEDYPASLATMVNVDVELEEAVDIMERAGVRRLPVTEDGIDVIGMISFDEIALDLRHFLNAFLTVAGQYHRDPATA